MKTLEELRATTRLVIEQHSADGGWAYAYLASSKKERPCSIVFSNGGGWEHVSVSFPNRCPTWEEMCEVKDMFFYEEEIAVQYHPPRNEYVNMHPYCLHLWRLKKEGLLMPPSWMVGVKDGETTGEVMREATKSLTTF